MDVNLWRAVWYANKTRDTGKAQRGLRIALGVSVLPMFGLMSLLGATTGRDLPHMDPIEVGKRLMMGLLALGVISGVWNGSCALRFEPLRPFQVSRITLFIAELMVAIQTPVKRYLIALAIGWSLGLSTIHPVLLPWLMPGILLLLLWLIVVERTVGALTRQFTSINFKLLSLYFLLLLAFWIFLAKAENRPTDWFPSWHSSLRYSNWFPTTQMVMGWQGVLYGEWSPSKLFIYPILWTIFLLLGAYWALRSTLSGEVAPSFALKAARPWVFKRPWAGVAWHQWHTTWNSKIGRLFLFLPLIGLDAVVTPLVFETRPSSTWIIGCLGWLQVTLGFCFNVFGFDRGGVRGFWTLPLKEHDLLVGKLVGTAAYQAVILTLFAACLPFFASLSWSQGVSAVLFSVSLFFAHARSGLRHSIEHPRPLDPAGITPNELDDAFFIKLVKLLLPWLALVSVWDIASRWGPWPLFLGMALISLVAFEWLRRGFSPASDCLRLGRDQLTAVLECSSPVNR